MEDAQAKAALLRKRREKDKKKKKVKRDRMVEYEHMIEQTLDDHIKEFQKGLETFSREFSEEIDRDQNMQKTLYVLCSRLGLDPMLMRHSVAALESCRDQAASLHDKRHVNFLHALGMTVLDVCEAKKDLDGGLCDVDMVMDRVAKRGGSVLEARPRGLFKQDILHAIGILSDLGNSIGVIDINGKEYVKCSPVLFSGDCTKLLELFHKCQGRFTRREAMDALSWKEDRVANALMALAREGMVMIDKPPEAMPHLYWCPAVKYNTSMCL